MPGQVHVVGARPNFIKAAPVISALSEIGTDLALVHTGQHYEQGLSDVFFSELGLPSPHRNLGVGSASHGKQTADLMMALESYFVESAPDLVVVYGDVNSTLAGSMVAAKMGIPVAHVEAGLRSFDRSMPEEINRIVTDALSSQHFTTTEDAGDHLQNEGVAPDGIHFVGNPMIDTLIRYRDRLDSEKVKSELGVPDEYAVATVHRPANVDDADIAKELVSALELVATSIPIVLPLHPRGRKSLERAGLMDLPRVMVTAPLGYLDFMALMTGARLVLSDSGGIQEETTFLGIPCLTLRDNTERPVTVTMGTNRLVGRDPKRIHAAALEVLSRPPRGQIPPLWDGKAGLRIASILRN